MKYCPYKLPKFYKSFFVETITCNLGIAIQYNIVFYRFYRRICSVLSIWIDQYPRDFDEPPSYNNLNRLIRFMEKRSHISSVKDLYTRCDHKLTTLTVSPFDDERKLFTFFKPAYGKGTNCAHLSTILMTPVIILV